MKYSRHEAGIKRFGLKLRAIRRKQKLSQEALANAADLEISQISRIERGVINTSLSQIFFIAEALKVHPKELFEDLKYEE